MDLEARLGRPVPFYKMQGCGNDFVFVDNRELGFDPADMPEIAVPVCRKSFGVGADGMMFLDEAPAGSGLNYVWHFFNADGSRAAMCGNGARCAAKLAWLIGLAGARQVFGTDAGPIEAVVDEEQGLVTVQLTEPADLRLDMTIEIQGAVFPAHYVNTGVPHVVMILDEVETTDVWKLGRAIRYHQAFAPAGTNVNFVAVSGNDSLSLRTYERGVEDETYACGTGAVASVVVASALGLVGDEVAVTTTGGEELGVILQGGRAYLRGGAELVFQGLFYPRSMGFDVE